MARSDGKPENQHYVPKMLLRNFSFDGRGEEPQVHVFDKREDGAFATGISNVAAKCGFYDLEHQGVEASLEPAMSDIEMRTAAAFAKLLQSSAWMCLRPKRKA